MLVQKLKCFTGVGGATEARIERYDDRGVFRIITLCASRVVELLEFPISWGIWTCREALMSSDVKASGRTTSQYDATPPV